MKKEKEEQERIKKEKQKELDKQKKNDKSPVKQNQNEKNKKNLKSESKKQSDQDSKDISDNILNKNEKFNGPKLEKKNDTTRNEKNNNNSIKKNIAIKLKKINTDDDNNNLYNIHNKRKNSPTLLKENKQSDNNALNSIKDCMSAGKRIKNDSEQNTLYRDFLKNIRKDKEKLSKKPQTSKTINNLNIHPENAYRTFGIWRFKNKNILKKHNHQNTINEESLSNHINQKLAIDIVNPNTLLKKNSSELNTKYGNNKNNIDTIKPYYAISDDDKYNDTGIEDNYYDKYDENKSRKYAFSTKKMKLNKWKNDPCNPYLTNWANSFLKIGYNVGFHFCGLQKGVPLLRIQKLRKKVVLPPLYKIKYNKFTEKNYDNDEDDVSKIVCSKVAQKVSNTLYNFHNNKTKNTFDSNFNFGDKDKNKEQSQTQRIFNEDNGINSI